MRALDLGGVSSVADYFVIATGNSAPHIHAMAEDTVIRLKQAGIPVYRREGHPDSGWIVLDYGVVVAHLMVPEARDYYSLENLWNDAHEIPTDKDGRLKAAEPKPKKPRATKPKVAKAAAGEVAAKKKPAARKPRAPKA
jgi:ribosome-associated protein